MPRLLRKQFAGAKYHVTSRGNGRRTIFHGDGDRERFVWQLEECLKLDGVILYCYVLMSNHYHLLVETPRGNLSGFMHRLNTAYSTYYRYRHRHAGSVLQPRYKSPLVSGDDYLIRLTRYIHLNPIKTREMEKLPWKDRIEHLRQYRWSSYAGYVEKSKQEEIVDYKWRELIGGETEAGQRRAYRKYAESMVEGADDVLLAAIDASEYAIGDEGFVAEVETEMREAAQKVDAQEDVIWPQEEEEKPGIGYLDELVCHEYGCRPEALREHGRRAGEAKELAVTLACSHGGLNNREVGRAYGMTGAGVARARRHFSQRLTESPDLAKRYARIVRRLEAHA